MLQRVRNLRRHMHHWTIEYACGWKRIAPPSALGVNGRQVPQHAVVFAACRHRLWRAGVVRHLIRQNVSLIPILVRPSIRNPAKHAGGRADPIAGKDRLPDNEYAGVRVRMLGKDLLDRGGPPQTSCSGGREQQHEPRVVRRGIEIRLQRGKRRCIQCCQRRLARWNPASTEALPGERREQHHDRRDDEERSTFASHIHFDGSKSAAAEAMTWGKSKTSATTAAETQRMTRLVRLRRWHARAP